jgi:hypothetical protein
MAVAALLSTATLAAAQVAADPAQQPLPPSFTQLGLVIYPAQGQTPEQQALDEAACWEWAEAQTGVVLVAGSVDTEAAAEQAAAQAGAATQGAAVQGAARGAVAGVAIGAIAGDAGKGAAIGAAAGAIGGRRARKRAQQEAAQQGAAQAEAGAQATIDTFKTTGGVCLSGRGYTVG